MGDMESAITGISKGTDKSQNVANSLISAYFVLSVNVSLISKTPVFPQLPVSQGSVHTLEV